jgi:hypothetical protein
MQRTTKTNNTKLIPSHNTDSLYVQDYIPEKHTQQIEQLIWSAHEVTTRHSTHIQRLLDDHIVEECQKGLH